MLVLGLLVLLASHAARAFNERVVFSEIQYSAPIGSDYEYLEVCGADRGRRVLRLRRALRSSTTRAPTRSM